LYRRRRGWRSRSVVIFNVAARSYAIAKGRIVYSGTPAALAGDRELMLRHLSV
jgi:ABC-type branched-subunit amino acid transport system ATPase component